MSSVLGQLSVFDHRTQDWEIFDSRLVQFLKLNSGIKDEQKCALLLTHLADDTYRLASNLVHPHSLDSITYNQLIAVLNVHFKPKRCIFADRERFYEARRAASESIEEWAARIRGLSVHCAFESSLEKLITDKFVLGLSPGPEKDRLFEHDATTLTFAKAVEIAQQTACARRVREQQLHVKEQPVYRVGAEPGRGRAAGAGGAAQRAQRCTVCGLKSHSATSNYRPLLLSGYQLHPRCTDVVAFMQQGNCQLGGYQLHSRCTDLVAFMQQSNCPYY